MTEIKEAEQHKGWLYKWTNYLRGYQKRWFVLQNGLLSYYRNQAEMSHTCRGTINLANATIDGYDSHTFVISNGVTQTYHLRATSEVERKKWVTALVLAKSKTITLAQADEDEPDTYGYSEKADKDVEISQMLQSLGNHLNDLRTCQQLVKRQGDSLIKSLGDIESLTPQSDTSSLIASPPISPPVNMGSQSLANVAGSNMSSSSTTPQAGTPINNDVAGPMTIGSTPSTSPHPALGESGKNWSSASALVPGGPVYVATSPSAASLGGVATGNGAGGSQGDKPIEFRHSKNSSYGGNIVNRYKTVNEKATVFKVATSAMINKCTEFENYTSGHIRRWQRLLSSEREQRARLEKMVEELAKQHSALEKKIQTQSSVAVSPVCRGGPGQPDEGLETPDGDDGGRSRSLGVPEPSGNHRGQVQLTRIYLPGHAATKNEYDETEDEDSFFDAVDFPDEEHEAFCVSLPPLDSSESRGSKNRGDRDSGPTRQQEAAIYSPDEYESETESDWESSAARKRTEVRVVPKKRTSQQLDKVRRELHKKEHRRTLSSGESKEATPTTEDFTDASGSRRSSSAGKMRAGDGSEAFQVSLEPRTRRNSIPFRPNVSVNLWGIIKNCIGKDLSKIPLPVNFNEPLSMLQRLTEDLEYSECLDAAAACTDSIEQLAHVAAFTVSSYSTTTVRTGKPFNPLLGETFECDRRDDMGWRSVAEQVSHHPPAAAIHAESANWKCSQEFTMSSKFRGKYIAIIPLGIAHVTFNNSNNHYTWRKVTSTVHNIIVGKLWIDNHGEMDIFNHSTGDTCHLSYKPYSYFSRDTPRRVTGVITDKSGKARYVLNGTWDEFMEGAQVISIKQTSGGQPLFETGPTQVLWKRNSLIPNSEKMYNFTKFAIELNEPETGMAPTDSRLRPDQRLMENGRWDEANREKERLEEKQRSKRRIKEREAEELKKEGREQTPYEPLFFKPQKDEITGNPTFVFNNSYWSRKEEQDWSNCSDIY